MIEITIAKTLRYPNSRAILVPHALFIDRKSCSDDVLCVIVMFAHMHKPVMDKARLLKLPKDGFSTVLKMLVV